MTTWDELYAIGSAAEINSLVRIRRLRDHPRADGRRLDELEEAIMAEAIQLEDAADLAALELAVTRLENYAADVELADPDSDSGRESRSESGEL